LLALLMYAVLGVGLGCSGAEDKARQAQQAEAKAIAEIADGIRPLLARCEQLGMSRDPPEATKVLVIDLKAGKRHKATDELPEAQRGRSSDADLLVFAVVSVSEERLKEFYLGGTDGIQLTAKVAAVGWPKKEPVGFYPVKAPPPEYVASFMRKEETPRGNLDAALARAIKDKHWPKSLSDRPEEFILGLWQTAPGARNPLSIVFQADGTFSFPDSARDTLGLPGTDVFSKHHYKFVDKSTIELEFDVAQQSRLGKTARILDLTNHSFFLTLKGGTGPSYTLQRGK
jgi:hypothetical protein